MSHSPARHAPTRRRPLALCTVAAALAAGGCVDRRIHITSEPPGALIHLNDVEVGRTPCEVDFTYFGVYDVRLRLAGYEPLVTKAEAKAPFHEQPGIDLVAMAVPVTKRTRVDWNFVLEPVQEDREGLLIRAVEVRGMLGAMEMGEERAESDGAMAPMSDP